MFAKDRLSSLPHEILILIVSRLHIKEAVRSSILSRRWVDLWKYIESLVLDYSTFVGLSKIWKLSDNGLELAALDEFRVVHTFFKIYPHDFDEWIKFALQMQLRKLKIDMYKIHLHVQDRHYNERPSLAMASRNFHCKSLVVLRLNCVDVTEDDIRCFVSNCPLLEEIAVWLSRSLVNLDIDIPMPRLKHLEMRCCDKLTGLQVSAPNLRFFNYMGPNIAMVPFKDDIHYLDQLTIGGDYLEFFLLEFSKWQTYQVNRLNLQMFIDCTAHQKCVLFPSRITKFGKLRELHLICAERNTQSILWLTSLMEGSPLLHTLDIVLHSEWYDDTPEAVLLESITEVKKVGSVRCPHKLRKVMVEGCSGSFLNILLITYLMENATCIEKMNFRLNPGLFLRKERRDVFVGWVMELKQQLPAGTELAVLDYQ